MGILPFASPYAGAVRSGLRSGVALAERGFPVTIGGLENRGPALRSGMKFRHRVSGHEGVVDTAPTTTPAHRLK